MNGFAVIKTKSGEEVEIKLRVPDLAGFRRILKQLHARKVHPRVHERNTLYDTPANDLRRRGQLIRIRTEQIVPAAASNPKPARGRGIVTLKGPVGHSSRRRHGAGGNYKIRSESESVVADFRGVEAAFNALGLKPSFRYEKFRTTYALPGIVHLKVEVDETPIGQFVELEGPRPAILRAARLLGYSRPDFISVTYGDLYLADCRRHGRKPGDMLFHPTKKR